MSKVSCNCVIPRIHEFMLQDKHLCFTVYLSVVLKLSKLPRSVLESSGVALATLIFRESLDEFVSNLDVFFCVCLSNFLSVLVLL